MSLKYTLLIAICSFLFVSCKPTEKNYQAAYDAAKAKREYVDPDQALLTGGHALLDDDSSNWLRIGADSLELQRIRLKPLQGEWPHPGPYRLAVAMFKMDTNAKSLAADLSSQKDITPLIAKDGQDRIFLTIGSASTPDSLAAPLAAFRRQNPSFAWIGLTPPRPIVIYSR